MGLDMPWVQSYHHLKVSFSKFLVVPITTEKTLPEEEHPGIRRGGEYSILT